MRYGIYLNQVKMLEWGINLAQASVFSVLNEAHSWAKTSLFDGEVYYWFSRSKLIEELPSVTDKPDTISRHLITLERVGLIKRKLVNQSGKSYLYVSLTNKAKEWNLVESQTGKNFPTDMEKNPQPSRKNFPTDMEKNPQPSRKNFPTDMEKNPPNTITSNTNTSNKNTNISNKDLLCDSAESNAPAEIDPVQKFDAKSKRAMLIDAFESFWSAYQKKSGRKTALNSFLKIKLPNDQAVAIELINTVINQAKRWGDLYALAPTDEKQFQPHPSTWINNERWTDEVLPTVGAPRPNFSRPSNGFDADQARETFNDWANGNTSSALLGDNQPNGQVIEPNSNDIDGEWWK